MPEIILFQEDREKIALLLDDYRETHRVRGVKFLPDGLRKGTWARLWEFKELDILEMSDLRALAREIPEILEVLGLPTLKAA